MQRNRYSVLFNLTTGLLIFTIVPTAAFADEGGNDQKSEAGFPARIIVTDMPIRATYCIKHSGAVWSAKPTDGVINIPDAISRYFNLDDFSHETVDAYAKELKRLEITRVALPDPAPKELIARLLQRTPTIDFLIMDATGLTSADIEEIGRDGKNVQELCLQDCSHLKDLSFLSEWTQLEELTLYCCRKLEDISALCMMKNLKNIYLGSASGIKNLTPLAGLNKLETIDVSAAWRMTDISGLSNLTGLRNLYITHCRGITSISCLKRLTNLKELDLSLCTSINDSSVLDNLQNLIRLDLSHCTNIKDLSSLSRLAKLRYLNLACCENISDISPLAGMKELRRLHLSGCPKIKEFQAIGDLKKLELLVVPSGINDQHLRYLKEQGALNNLSEIHFIRGENLTDLSVLIGLPKLKRIDFSGCYSDLQPQVDMLRKKMPDCEIREPRGGTKQEMDKLLADLSSPTEDDLSVPAEDVDESVEYMSFRSLLSSSWVSAVGSILVILGLVFCLVMIRRK